MRKSGYMYAPRFFVGAVVFFGLIVTARPAFAFCRIDPFKNQLVCEQELKTIKTCFFDSDKNYNCEGAAPYDQVVAKAVEQAQQKDAASMPALAPNDHSCEAASIRVNAELGLMESILLKLGEDMKEKQIAYDQANNELSEARLKRVTLRREILDSIDALNKEQKEIKDALGEYQEVKNVYDEHATERDEFEKHVADVKEELPKLYEHHQDLMKEREKAEKELEKAKKKDDPDLIAEKSDALNKILEEIGPLEQKIAETEQFIAMAPGIAYQSKSRYAKTTEAYDENLDVLKKKQQGIQNLNAEVQSNKDELSKLEALMPELDRKAYEAKQPLDDVSEQYQEHQNVVNELRVEQEYTSQNCSLP